MSTPSTARPKRTRSTTAAATKTSTRALPSAPPNRHDLIAKQAYRRAESRGFQGGDPLVDWLESEKEVDALLRDST